MDSTIIAASFQLSSVALQTNVSLLFVGWVFEVEEYRETLGQCVSQALAFWSSVCGGFDVADEAREVVELSGHTCTLPLSELPVK